MIDFPLTTDVKGQHTVPRFLLNYFGYGKEKNKLLYTFDKKNKKVFPQSVKDATTRNKFYNFESNIDNASLEPLLGVIENDVAPIFERIVKSNSLDSLTKSDRDMISVFVIIQRARTFGSLQQLNDLSTQLFSMFPNLDKNDVIGEDRNLFLSLLVKQLELTPYILNKVWVLYAADVECPFYISDNPVALHNHNKNENRGNLGLGVEGIQIHMPLTPYLSIAFLCPSISAMFIESAKKINEIKVKSPSLLTQLNDPDGILRAASCIKNGTAYKLSEENIIFHNSLQVTFSEQYLFSIKKDFELAIDMVGNNKEREIGLRYQ